MSMENRPVIARDWEWGHDFTPLTSATFPITCSLVKVCTVRFMKALSTLHSWPACVWLEGTWARPGFMEIFGGMWEVCTRILGTSSRGMLRVRNSSHWNKWKNQLCLLEQEIPSHQACPASSHLASSEASWCPFMGLDEAALWVSVSKTDY